MSVQTRTTINLYGRFSYYTDLLYWTFSVVSHTLSTAISAILRILIYQCSSVSDYFKLYCSLEPRALHIPPLKRSRP